MPRACGSLPRCCLSLESDPVATTRAYAQTFLDEATLSVASAAQAVCMDKIVALRPLPNGFELQAPPSLKVLREQAELRELKRHLLAVRAKRLASS